MFADLIYYYAFTKTSVVNAVLIGHTQSIFILKEDKLAKFDYIGIFFMIIAGEFLSQQNKQTIENMVAKALNITT